MKMRKNDLRRLNNALADLACDSKSLDLEVNHGQQFSEEAMRDFVDLIFTKAMKVALAAQRSLVGDPKKVIR